MATNARLEDQRRYELQHEQLAIRLALTGGGAVLALAGSAMPWTHGLGRVTEGRLSGDGRWTAMLALALLGCAGWYYRRPERISARLGAAVAVALLALAIVEWNTVSDDVDSANHANGLFATASVAPGIWVLLIGAILATIGALWTLRVDR
ncbi:MAG TPA: hypothetical protein VFH74_09225 [Gaiellales bacterium]|nr:hypothetical protein [Gaiellales bacterium]